MGGNTPLNQVALVPHEVRRPQVGEKYVSVHVIPANSFSWSAAATTTYVTSPAFTPPAALTALFDSYRVKNLRILLSWRPQSTSGGSSQTTFAVAFDPSNFTSTPTYDQICNYRNSGQQLFTVDTPVADYLIRGCTSEYSGHLSNAPFDTTTTWTTGQFAIAPMFGPTDAQTIFYQYEWTVEYMDPRNL